MENREEGIGGESVPGDEVVRETNEVDQFGGDAGVGDTDNVGGVVCVVAESRRCAAELLLDASENIFDRGSGS